MCRQIEKGISPPSAFYARTTAMKRVSSARNVRCPLKEDERERKAANCEREWHLSLPGLISCVDL